MPEDPFIAPSAKHPLMEQAITDIFGTSRHETAAKRQCATCNKPATEFRNEISRREYSISQMCQKCQDSIFGID